MPIPPNRKLVKACASPAFEHIISRSVEFWFEFDDHGMSIYAESPDGRVFHWDGHLVGPVGGKLEPAKPRE